jgi:diacylglycerol kinase (ATP)
LIKKCVIILNPIAGKGNAAKKLPVIRDYLENSKLEYEIVLTRHAGHGITLAKEHGTPPDTVVIAAGGDGTCNEIINGLMQVKDRKKNPPHFGVLPIGRGNDFSYGVGIPKDLGEALELIPRQNTRKIDIGEVTGGFYPKGRFFGNGIGIGFDTIVGLEAAKMKHVHGAASYVIGALKTFLKYPAAPFVELEYNGKKQKLAAIQVSIMNGSRMGGTLFMAPRAEQDDGKFDLCICKQVTRRVLMKTIIRYTKGTQHELENIITENTDKLKITAQKGVLIVHADGETICTEGRELEINIHPSALYLINGRKA